MVRVSENQLIVVIRCPLFHDVHSQEQKRVFHSHEPANCDRRRFSFRLLTRAMGDVDDESGILECLNLTSLANVSDFRELDMSNCSYWETHGDDRGRNGLAPAAWKVLIFVPLVIISICGNSLIIHVLYKFKQTRSCANIFIGNMAIADLLSTIFLTWPGVVVSIHLNYPLGEFYCQYESVFKFSCLIASQLSLITLSADRLKKVIWPFRRSLQIRHAVAICVGIWVVAILISAPMGTFRLLETKIWKDFIEVWCQEKLNRKKVQLYWFILLAIVIYFPLFLMLAFYSTILCQMKKYEERLNESGNPVRSLRRKRIIQMVWVYLVVAFVCWTPLQVIVFYRRLALPIMDTWYYTHAVFAQHFMASLNPAINPIIYGVVNETFRRAITLQFPCLSKILKPQPLSTVSRTRPSQHQTRASERNIIPSSQQSSSPSPINRNQLNTLSTDLQSHINRLSVVMNERL